ncbi:MAG: hypothetical protein JWP61_346 [Friedmanniella sp.]|nr:hypothetical protein [Friedmanniella sp.]
MTRSNARLGLVIAGAVLLTLAGTPAAMARPDADVQPTVAVAPARAHCALERIGTQAVRCDDLTGDGVAASPVLPVQVSGVA